MTYTEAIRHNAQFNMPIGHKKPREIADGAHLRWVMDPTGRIGYIKTSRPDAILVYYPIKAFRINVRTGISSWDANKWDKFKLLEG